MRKGGQKISICDYREETENFMKPERGWQVGNRNWAEEGSAFWMILFNM